MSDLPENTPAVSTDRGLLEMFPESFAREHGAVPVRTDDGRVAVAVAAGGASADVLEYVKFRCGAPVSLVSVRPETLRSLIESGYGGGEEAEGVFSPDSIRRMADEASAETGSPEDGAPPEHDYVSLSSPVVRLSNSIIEEAFSKRASDIHIEPYENELRVRYRIDGVLYVFHRFPPRIAPALTSRLKVMCELDIAEKRRAQQGRMNFRASGGRSFECRISVVPVIFGEKVAVRILDKGPLHFSLGKLGFTDAQLADFEKSVRAENGMVLIAGPTGSGKTTTLYSVIEEIKSEETNIITAEDPIEYNLPGISQVQVREAVGLTFPECLRTFLRQDPDVILVGEIRDRETADIAVKASLTGHLMLSTIHTTDALSAVVRLLDMGVEPFLVASSLRAVAAQRLVRVICERCSRPLSPSAPVSPEFAGIRDGLREGAGCPACSNLGYRGREAVYEVAVVDAELREMIVSGAPLSDMRKWASRAGMSTMRKNAVLKLKRGVTTAEEVLKNTPADEK